MVARWMYVEYYTNSPLSIRYNISQNCNVACQGTHPPNQGGGGGGGGQDRFIGHQSVKMYIQWNLYIRTHLN